MGRRRAQGWGGGFEEGTVEQFSHYIKAVDNFNARSLPPPAERHRVVFPLLGGGASAAPARAQVTAFDRVLVDGRARAPCAEYVLKFLHPDSLVFIHDYQARFFYHGVVERFYSKVAETYDGQTLVVLRPKPEALAAAARSAVAKLASN